jgi:hypothetical protein
MMNHLKEKENDTIQARSHLDFGVKFSIIQFYIIKHYFQFDCWIEFKFLHVFLDMLLYMGLKFQVIQISIRDYFRESNLLNESCQIYQFGPLSNLWVILFWILF